MHQNAATTAGVPHFIITHQNAVNLDAQSKSRIPQSKRWLKKMMSREDSHDEDGGCDEWGGVEASLAVGVLSLSLVHLPSAVLTTSTHTEEHAYDGGEHHDHNTDGRTYEESGLVVDPLKGGQDSSGYHFTLWAVTESIFASDRQLLCIYLKQEDDVFRL